jgi:hypothetical protein
VAQRRSNRWSDMTTLQQTMFDLTGLRAALPTPEAVLIDLLLRRISTWSADESSVQCLIDDLDTILGEVWFSTNERHATVALVLARLRDTVDAVGGMTMNERRFVFDLMNRWNQASASDRDAIRTKLNAGTA